LAESYARAGRAGAAFNLLVEAVSRVDSHAERWWEPELYRVLGELLTQPENAAVGEPILERARGQVPRTAEACLLHALELARATRARAFELRAALSLARLWRDRGQASRGLALVSSIYQWFGEGFETADLREARRFLETDSPNRAAALT
jgi:predicted ATPase